jgi:diaminopimelate decarboxylase
MTSTPTGIPASEWFVERGAELHVEAVPLSRVAESIGTPCYVYSASAIDTAYRRIDQALEGIPHLIAYAVKANGNLSILRRLARAGAGADIVSGGELARALKAGFAPERIVFSGVGKTDAELAEALDAGIRSIHAESEGELRVLERIARERGKVASVALRVNPDVDAKTHPYIATGLHSTKFGVDFETARRLLPWLLQSQHLSLEGVACHIGSMVLSPEPLGEAAGLAAAFAVECAEAGAPIRSLDAGGGWPVLYGNEGRTADGPEVFARSIKQGLDSSGASARGIELIIEPGRAIVADSAVLLTRVLQVKTQGTKRFVIVDAAMTELIRPALYGAYHAVVPVRVRAGAASPADVVGPVCESADFLAKDRALPPLERGDLLAIRGAGAYAAAMASNYNARPFAAEVMVQGADQHLVRARQSVEATWQCELAGLVD